MAFANPFLSASGRGTPNPFFPDEKATTSDLPLWQRDQALDQLSEQTRPTISKLLGWLGVPASIAYDIATGNELGSGTTGGDVLEQFGLRPDKDSLGGWGRPLAEFAFEATTDPLNLVAFGAGTTGRAAQAARAAGIMDDAVRVAGRKVANATNPLTGDFGYAKSASKVFTDADGFGKQLADLTDDDLLSRPLVGARAARRNMTLDELVQSQANVSSAKEAVEQFARKNYGVGYGDIARERLYNDIGLTLPKFLGGSLAGNLPGGDAAAKAFDRVGQAVRWSPLGRNAVALANVFGDRVAGQTDEMGQILAKSDWRGRVRADQRAGMWRAGMLRELAERSPNVFTDTDLSTAARNVIEGTASAAEQAAVQQNDLTDFVTKWQAKSNDILERSRRAGVSSAELDDPYGTGYFPRGVDDGVFDRGRAIKDSGKDYSVNTPDQIARDEAYKVPGGTDQINRLSRDTNVLNAANDNDAANYIYTEVNATRGASEPEYSFANAVKLARDIRSIAPKARAAGRGLFDSHFTEDASRYVQGRERAIERAKLMAQTLGSSAKDEHYLNVAGGSHVSMSSALADLGLRTANRNSPFTQSGAVGAIDNVIRELNKKLQHTALGPITAKDIGNVSIDQRIVERFQRIADYYAVPEAQGQIVQFLDDLTSLWKSSVLSWPSRFARDWFSGAISNLIEVGNPLTLTRGYAASKRLIEGRFDQLGNLVSQMPKYQALAAQDMNSAIAAYQDDLAAAGLLTGRRIDDFGTTLTGRQTGESLLSSTLPGARPVTTLGNRIVDLVTGNKPLPHKSAAYSELYNVPAYVESLDRARQAINPFDDRVKFTEWLGDRELKDPILRWASKLGDTTDSINRLAGYNALLLQGIQPQEAARRMAAAQVDYGNLTPFEKGFIRRVVPFWSYNSRIGSYIVQKVWEKPGGAYTQVAMRLPEKLSEVGNDDAESYLPKQIKENVGFSLEPFREMPGIGSIVNTLAPEKEGVNSYLNSIEVPGTGLINMVNVKQGLDGSIQPLNSIYSTGLDVTGNLMHPLIRYGVEALSGRNLHTGKSLVEFTPTIQKLGREMGVAPGTMLDRSVRGLDAIADFVPHAPRVLQMVNRLTDDERVPDLSARLLQTANNALTGVKVTNIGEDAARMDASRELMDMLADSPMIRRYENRFIPEELLPFASPEELLIYRLDRQMKKEARDARKRSDPSGSNPFGL